MKIRASLHFTSTIDSRIPYRIKAKYINDYIIIQDVEIYFCERIDKEKATNRKLIHIKIQDIIDQINNNKYRLVIEWEARHKV